MARRLFWLSDEEWTRIDPWLPHGRRGAHRVEDRRVISGIVHMLKTGARWRDCPAEYGPYTTIYNRFNRWSKQGVWEDVFHALSGSNRSSRSSRRPVSRLRADRIRSLPAPRRRRRARRPVRSRRCRMEARHSRAARDADNLHHRCPVEPPKLRMSSRIPLR